tara:strand:+ start:6488 stop:9199 length:2712 start_codon:yes stop_codon:yes gene_type:complete
MAETLISPGVLARENDQSQITSQPIQAGAAIVGPTVLGLPNIPKLVTSYSEYLASYGSTFLSGSDTYSFFTSISAQNYFQNGGTSLLVTRVVSSESVLAPGGVWSHADSSNVYNALESGKINIINLTASLAPTNTSVAAFGRVFSAAPQDLVAGSYTLTPVASLAGVAPQCVVNVTGTGSIDSIVPVASGSGFVVGEELKFAGTDLLGGGSLVIASVGFTNFGDYAGDGSAVGTVSSVATTLASGNGNGAQAAVTIALDGTLLASANTLPVGGTNTSTGFNAGGSGTSGTPHTITSGETSGAGAGGTLSFTTNASGEVLSVDILAAGGTNYAANEQITINAAAINTAFGNGGGTGQIVITLGDPNLKSAPKTFAIENLNTVGGSGTRYAAGNTLQFPTITGLTGTTQPDFTIVAGNLAAAVDVKVVLSAGQIDNQVAFVLESLGEGAILNNTGTESTQGALALGSSNNFRWEIQAPDVNQGVFSLILRQGNDNSKNKSVLETYPNVSLDPKQSNYIGRVIGTMEKTVATDADGNKYIQDVGNFPNASRYVRVKQVNYKTPNYFDNDGLAKDIYTSSIPLVGSGSFGGADGINVNPSVENLYYDKISAAGSGNSANQGISGSDYITALSILANKDDYSYNIISSPGLVQAFSGNASPLNTLYSNCSSRGDVIAVSDMQGFGAATSAVVTTAKAIDNSYVATYWPWVQITEPDSGDLVWIPGSTLIPGVYAYNDKAAEAWFAPAGINRGGLGSVIQAERKLTQSTRDTLYTGKINPIATFPGRGVVVFGQKTLQTKASALDRVNVRRLLIELKSYISQISDNLVFEQNTAATRNQFLSQVNPYLESVQQRQGLYAFKVVMDASNNGPDVIDRNQLVGAIYLQPTKTAEFIYLDFNILPTGATFPA